jgi:hypothetical protein
MNALLKVISFAGLVLTVVPSALVFTQKIGWDTHATLMIVGTLMWFLTVPLWMKKDVS